MYTCRLPVHAYLGVRVFSDRMFWPSDFLWFIGLCCMVVFNVLNYQLNANVSRTYRRMRAADRSKRVQAIDIMAHKVWPFVSLIGGVAGWAYFHKKFAPYLPA